MSLHSALTVLASARIVFHCEKRTLVVCCDIITEGYPHYVISYFLRVVVTEQYLVEISTMGSRKRLNRPDARS